MTTFKFIQNAASSPSQIFPGLKQCKLQRFSDTIVQCLKKNNQENKVVINSQVVTVPDTVLTIDVSTNLIGSDGLETAAPPSRAGLYYVYLSNNLLAATALRETIRLSETAPNFAIGSDYLNISGEGANWRLVGLVYLTTSGETLIVVKSYNVANYGNSLFTEQLTENLVVPSGGTAGDTEFLKMENILLLPGQKLLVMVEGNIENGSSDAYRSIAIYFGETQKAKSTVYHAGALRLQANYMYQAYTTPEYITISAKSSYQKMDDLTVASGAFLKVLVMD